LLPPTHLLALGHSRSLEVGGYRLLSTATTTTTTRYALRVMGDAA